MLRSALTNDVTGRVSHKRLIAFMFACTIVIMVLGVMFLKLSVPEYMFYGLISTIGALAGGSITESVMNKNRDERKEEREEKEST